MTVFTADITWGFFGLKELLSLFHVILFVAVKQSHGLALTEPFNQ